MKRLLLVLIVVALVVGVAFAGGRSEAPASGPRTLSVATDATWPPMVLTLT